MQEMHGTPAHGDDLPLVEQMDEQWDEEGRCARQESNVEEIHRILRAR